MKLNKTTSNLLTFLVIVLSAIAGLSLIPKSLSLNELKNEWSYFYQKQRLLAPELESVEDALKNGRIDEHLLYFVSTEEIFHLREAKNYAASALDALEVVASLNITDQSLSLITPIKHALNEVVEVPSANAEQAIAYVKTINLYSFSIQEQFRHDVSVIKQLELEHSTRAYQKNLNNLESLTLAFNLNTLIAAIIFLSAIALVLYLRSLEAKALNLVKVTREKLEITQELNAQSRFASALFSALPVSVITINDRGIIQRCNPATHTMLGYSEEDLVGENVKKIMPMPIATQHDRYLSNYKKTKINNIIGIGREVTAKTKAGHNLDVHLSVTSYELDDVTEYAGILVDLSEIMAQRDEIANAIIEIELSNKELEIAIKKANAATEAQDMFLATASHEIRTPLTGMFGMIDLLDSEALSPEQAQYLSILRTSGKQLMAIVNDILDSAKLRDHSLELHLEPHSLYEINEFISATYTPLAAQKGLDLSVKAPSQLKELSVLADHVRLVQIVSNLCSNAVKFTEQGHVTFEIETISEDEHAVEVKFSINDSGTGIEQADIERLTKPFVQLDNQLNRSGTGTGLGLMIASSLIKKMGGKLEIHSIVGVGSRFSFSLTFQKSEVTDTPPAESARPLPENKTITLNNRDHKPSLLIAEDNPVNRMVIEKLLSQLSVDFHMVENGQALVNEAKKTAYDLIITDIQMPIMDGLEAAKVLRSLPETSAIPIVALTAASFSDDMKRMSEAGIDDVVAKPIDRTKLIAVIGRHLNKPA